MAIDNSCKVTNRSGTEVVVLNAVNRSTDVAADAIRQGYMQELSILPTGTGNTIADGATGTITLDGTYVDSKGETRPAYIYELLISKPKSLFPVASLGKALNPQTMGYDPVEVTAEGSARMAMALSFCINLMTAPGSKLSSAFRDAMTEALKKPTVAGIEAAMADFFNGYDTFRGLDFVSYVAVSTWMRGFASRWGIADDGTPGRTYYVYSAGTDGTSATTSEGTITFALRSPAPAVADPTDRNGGFDITLQATDGTTTPLHFDNGKLIDSEGGAIALFCTFGYKGTFTKKQADTTAWPMMTGMMLNRKVLVIPLPPESGWDRFWSSLTFSKLLDYFLKAMGLWMAIDFLKQKLKGKENRLEDDQANDNDGAPPDAEQQQAADDAAERIGDEAQAANRADAEQMSDGESIVPSDDESFDEVRDDVRDSGSEAYRSVASDNLSGSIDSAGRQLRDLSDLEVTESMQEAEGNLIEARSNLAEGNLAEASDNLGEVNEALPRIVGELGSAVSTELQDQVREAVEAQSEAQEIADETTESAEDTRSGDEEPFDEPIEL